MIYFIYRKHMREGKNMDDSTEKLKARISELENLIEKLRQEPGSMESAKTSTPYDDA